MRTRPLGLVFVKPTSLARVLEVLDLRVVDQTGVIPCPVCESQNCRPSFSTEILDYVMRLVGRVPFRCRHCRFRFYRPRRLVHDDESLEDQ